MPPTALELSTLGHRIRHQRISHGFTLDELGERYPIDEEFLAALAEMPEASGVALGFDRLVMLATGAPRLEAVLWAPVAE